MSFGFVLKSTQATIPAILLAQNTNNLISDCKLYGSKAIRTTGIVVKNASLVLKDSRIEGFNKMGVTMWLEEKDACNIYNAKVTNNKMAGIQIIGESKSPIIELCTIENNKGAGIQLLLGNKSTVTKNKITGNGCGLEIVSSDSLILKNEINMNLESGIKTDVVSDLLCSPTITNNIISSNNHYGVHVFGKNNSTKIEGNSEISYNKLAGIRCQKDEANIGDQTNESEKGMVVLKNNIFKNIHQGVLISEGSFAHIENNTIHGNIKANVALGGVQSSNTVIVNNRIYGGRCEGIFIVEGGYCIINQNKVYSNYDGIVCACSVPNISDNKIRKNKRCGVIVIKDSRPGMFNNKIYKNEEVGLYIKDKSKGKYVNNLIKDNPIELIVERKDPDLANIHKTNPIFGEIRTPQTYSCCIM